MLKHILSAKNVSDSIHYVAYYQAELIVRSIPLNE